MFKSVLELIDIMNYVGDFKRPFIEGSEIMKCNHILELHCTILSKNVTKIKALCLQTSDLNGKPHQVVVIKYYLFNTNFTKNLLFF